MRLEEGFEGRTHGLPGLVWLSIQQPRSLTDEGREFGGFGLIPSHHKRKVERRQHHVVKTGAVENPLDPRWVAPTELARLLDPNGAGGGTR